MVENFTIENRSRRSKKYALYIGKGYHGYEMDPPEMFTGITDFEDEIICHPMDLKNKI
jgi:hypothetical protein